MKKLIYSLSCALAVVVIFSICLFVNADSVGVVPIGTYEYDYSVSNLRYMYYVDTQPYYYLDDSVVYHNFYYNTTNNNNVSWYCGYNIWNEDWELGTINFSTGNNGSSSNRIRSKDYIVVNPQSTYYFYDGTYSANKYNAVVFFYTANLQYISFTYSSNSSFTTPDNAYFVRFFLESVSLTSYNNNVCINFYDSNVNGNYYESTFLGITDFNQRTIRVLNEYVPAGDDDRAMLDSILVDNNKAVTVSGWYSFSTGSFLTNFSGNPTLIGLKGSVVNPVNQGATNFSYFDSLEFNYTGNSVNEVLFNDRVGDRVLVAYARDTSPIDSWRFTQASKLMLDLQAIPVEVYNYFVDNGVFSYIGDFNDSYPTFADTVNTIISVPINYLRQLFNIELLGTSLFVILCSIMTIALVIYVIKKI